MIDLRFKKLYLQTNDHSAIRNQPLGPINHGQTANSCLTHLIFINFPAIVELAVLNLDFGLSVAVRSLSLNQITSNFARLSQQFTGYCYLRVRDLLCK